MHTLTATMFIIDFDDTLFDTKTFKACRVKALEKVGVSKEIHQETYELARNSSDGLFAYTSERHANELVKKGYDREEVLAAFKSVEDTLTKFLFPDTICFLTKLKSTLAPLILLSLGNPGFQEIKVKGCAIDHFFDRVFIVEESKVKVVGELLSTKPKEIWFINDKIKETLEVVKAYPTVKALLRCSPEFAEEDYQHSTLPCFKTLTAILDYVV